ncbi:MAG: flagellar biosynthetic protein FliR [Desulfovibrio sp.]|jgi:flagellar biosynthetic protein FliR|nr:flagellar biosynthetic protein FliR [Desulfovibrio sp.]
MDLFSFNAASAASFLLTLMRVSLVLFMLPFYGGEYIPTQVKAAMCLVLSMALWPHLSFPGELFPAHPAGLVTMMLAEALLGLTLGLCVYFIFAAIQTGGEIIGFQMGFTMVTLADPSSGAQVSITSHMLYTVALIIFLALDGHLHLLRALADSFRLMPPGGMTLRPAMTGDILALSGAMFSLAVKIAAPAIVALFTAELALALMGRAAPQMNLLTMGFPIKIAVGFFFMGIMFTIMSQRMEDLILDLGPMFNRLMHAAR